MQINEVKICSECHVVKIALYFHKDLHNKDGLRNVCKECAKINNKSYRGSHKEESKTYQKQYYEENKETLKLDREEFLKCWALSNLRPLSAKQNIIDGAKRMRISNKNIRGSLDKH